MNFQDYLRYEKLFTDEPYNQENIRSKEIIQTPTDSVVFDNFYKSKNEKIYCHICGGHRHYSGLTGQLSDGSRILFGSSCAKEFFGPEITRLCSADLKRRTKKANNRYMILDIANSVEPVEQWLRQYRPLVEHINRAWIDIHIKHEKGILPLLENLTRNNGRLLESSIEFVGGSAKKQEKFENHRIVTYISNSESIKNLKLLSQRVSLVEVFTQSVKSIKTEPNEILFDNLASMYKKNMEAAVEIDNAIQFTIDFFNPKTLDIFSKWMEEHRRRRLSAHAQVTKQNLAPMLRSIMGFGVERPNITLVKSLLDTGITDKLEMREKGEPAINRIISVK